MGWDGGPVRREMPDLSPPPLVGVGLEGGVTQYLVCG